MSDVVIGLLLGAFWLGLGVLVWWWPAAIFVAFSNEDVTPGARAFAVVAVFLGVVFLAMAISALDAGISLPATASIVGVLFLIEPVDVLGVSPEGPLTPRRAGVSLLACGAVAALVIVI